MRKNRVRNVKQDVEINHHLKHQYVIRNRKTQTRLIPYFDTDQMHS